MQRYKKIARDCAGTDLEYLVDATVMTVPDPCTVQKVEICPSAPVAPVTVATINCDGTTTDVDTEAGEAKRVVITGTDRPLKVCIEDPRDVAATQKCDVNTGNTILIRSVFNDETNLWEVPTYFDLITGADWTGNPATDLIECSDIDVESDPLIGCDNGVPVTQWVVKSNGEPTGVVYYTDATGAIITPVAWTPGACAAALQSVDLPNCDGTTTPQDVDQVTGTYLLNQKNLHTERLYDNITATLTGSVTTNVSGTTVTFDFSGVVATNWVGALYFTEFGNGFSDIGGAPSFDFANEPDGNYEIKLYRGFVFPEQVAWYYVTPVEITKVGNTVTVMSVNPTTVNRSITYTQKEVFQDYCGSTPVGVPYLADGSAATIVGNLTPNYREEVSEWLGATDANNNPVVAPTALTMLSGGYSIANGTWAATLGPDGTNWTNPGNLRSVTIRARKGTNTDAIVGNPNQVVIITSLNEYVLFPEDGAVTYSVEDGNIQDLGGVDTNGEAAALVIVNTL